MKDGIIGIGRRQVLMDYELEGMKWNDLFYDNKDIINGLKEIKELKTQNYYLTSFKRQIENDKELSKQQLTQLKRNARILYCELWNQKNNATTLDFGYLR